MPFSGKATYTAGATLPEIAEDVSDIITLVSPFETPLLDHLGDPQREASSTVHEWLEDALLPNSDAVDDGSLSNPTTLTTFTVENGDRFRVGDQIRLRGKGEIMLVTGVSGDDLTVTRQYGGTSAVSVVDDDPIDILGNAALEGDDAPAARFAARSRKQNYTQIFTSSIEVSGSQLAASTIGVADEMDWQKQERLRELLRDLENCVINGIAPAATQQGSATVRRTMNGIIPLIDTNIYQVGSGPIPAGGGTGEDLLTEDVLNAALRAVWGGSSGRIDTIVCNGFQKRRINSFIASSQRFSMRDTAFKQMVDVYESDFGVCRVVLSRWAPADTILLLDSSRIAVMPLGGRAFHFKPLAATGDAESGQVIGEY
ncbi:MAG TPA: DUF5309 family protein, partial [Phycisphaerales bacterium]|nr:DUF5309 family protein [Phycisphaerales bacterium]